jgi:hypothetical protein
MIPPEAKQMHDRLADALVASAVLMLTVITSTIWYFW